MKKVIMLAVMVLGFSSAAFAASAVAVIKGTQENSTVNGEVILTENNDGLLLEFVVENVSPGKHAFHIHEHGSCDEHGNAAGSHYNPENVQHGFLPKDGYTAAHAGDFGNIEAGEDGKGELELFLPGLTLTGVAHNVAGKAVILHEKVDDFGQPTGNAGGRIGCGIISLVEEEQVSSDDDSDMDNLEENDDTVELPMDAAESPMNAEK